MAAKLGALPQLSSIVPSVSLKDWFARAKYCGILLGLIAVGFFGHTSHWSFGFAKAEHPPEGTTHKPTALVDDQPTGAGWEITFPSEASLRRSGVKTSPLEQHAIRDRVKTTGVITYDDRIIAALSARVAGTVWRVVKQVGDPVRRGDVLVIIEAGDVGRAKAEFLSELVAVDAKVELLANLESVQGAVSGRQVREARIAVREAKIRLQNAEQYLVNLGLRVEKESFSSLSDTERAAKLQFLGLPAEIASRLDPAHTTSNLLAINASFDGVVIRHDAALGETVGGGKPIVEIADLRQMWLKLDVAKEDASKLAIGQRVRFYPDGIEKELVSEITWISTEMDEQTRTLQVRAEVENPIVSSNAVTGHEVRLLRSNTYGIGLITLGEVSSAYVVPITAILHADSHPLVFVRKGDLSFARVDVKLGIRDKQLVQIESSALKPGMEIVTQGSHVLKSEWLLKHMAATGP